MRSLIRTRTLAALCALLLVFASLANANAPARPIDRPEGPPELDPTMVGDPDAGQEIITFAFQGRILLIRLPRLFNRFHSGPFSAATHPRSAWTRRR